MIASLRGKITFRTEKFLILETNGVGYKVSATSDILSKVSVPEEVFLFIHTHVREDAIDLYGFLDRKELEFFEMLLSVSGIGPKGALSVLSIATLPTLRQAISTGDTSYLTKISGIGRKTAEKIVVELRDKIGKNGELETSASLGEELDAMEALKSLGYSQGEVREALKQVKGESTNAKIKEALKILGGR